MMELKFAAGLRAFCLVAVLVFATLRGADQRPSPVGLTRAQLLESYGEPKGQVSAGDREIMSFARERVVLRNGVVVEVEPLPFSLPVKQQVPSPVAPVEPAAPGGSRSGSPSAIIVPE